MSLASMPGSSFALPRAGGPGVPVPILSDTLLRQARRRALRRSDAEIAAHSRDHTLSIQAVALYLRLEKRERGVA